jgi:hypothetical protein
MRVACILKALASSQHREGRREGRREGVRERRGDRTVITKLSH